VAQSANLPGKAAPSRAPFADNVVAGGAGGLAGAGGQQGLIDDFAGDARGALLGNKKPLVHNLLHVTANFWIAQLVLGLAFKLRVRELNQNNGCQAFAGVLAGQVLFFFL
jgi:hypothetical protein